MVNHLKTYIGSRRKLRWFLLYLFFACLCCWAAVLFFIYYREKYIKNNTQNDTASEQSGMNIPYFNLNESHFYTAAVIDYDTLLRNDVVSTWKTNIQNYIDIIAECSKHMVDIVVFPEGGIHGYAPMGRYTALLTSSYVPSVHQFIVPCHHKDYEENALHYFSCAAKENNLYVAVNLIEKVSSPRSFTWDGHLLYNTEVVFDRNGMVIARYRKYNLYTEKWGYEISSPDKPELVTFTTDFGVEFGVFTCFDIFFDEPALELVKKRKITHFIHSSQMMTRLPFLTASSVEFGWSFALDVIVLSSSNPYPKYTIGTNVYFGRLQGTRTYIKPFRTSTIIISPVPINPHLTSPQYPDEYRSLQKYTPRNARPTSFLVEHVLNRMTTKPLIMFKNNTSNFTYKKATFECNISASWKQPGFIPNYQFIAYAGLNNYSVAAINNYVEICGLVLCSRTTYSSCLQPAYFEDALKMVFESVNVSTRSTSLDSVRIPTAFDSNLVALDGSNFHFSSHHEEYGGKIVNCVDMRLKHSRANLHTFGVYKFSSKSTPISYFNQFDNVMNLDMIM
ncbi:vanin-like protein 1 [Planococcus citri]|uniref:vanin-like protein 1 n=1 Tax=Planococcus citri TaxID=170843 RepID=UPI0031F7709E